MNLILIGYRCTGKTSVGKRLAGNLGMAFYDTDALIQEERNQTIQEIVASGGWTAFRAEEKKIIATLALQDNCVIALGGGAVLDPENMEVMKANGRVIWLMADSETILERMAKDHATTAQRPPLLGQDNVLETTLLLEQRTPLYRAAADRVIDTRGRNFNDIAGEILQWLS
jgi:shikimate kinase